MFQRLKDALALPQECRDKAAGSSLAYLFGSGERHMLPSFFNLLKHLQAQVQPASRGTPVQPDPPSRSAAFSSS